MTAPWRRAEGLTVRARLALALTGPGMEDYEIDLRIEAVLEKQASQTPDNR